MKQLYLFDYQNKAHSLASNWRGLAALYNDTKDRAEAEHAATLERCAMEVENKFGIERAEPKRWNR